MSFRLVPAAAMLVALVLGIAAPVDACTCVGPNPACKAFFQDDAAFVDRARASSIDTTSPQ